MTTQGEQEKIQFVVEGMSGVDVSRISEAVFAANLTEEEVGLSILQAVKEMNHSDRSTFLLHNLQYSELFSIIDAHNCATGEPRLQAPLLMEEIRERGLSARGLLALIGNKKE